MRPPTHELRLRQLDDGGEHNGIVDRGRQALGLPLCACALDELGLEVREPAWKGHMEDDMTTKSAPS